jgi:hypothetical protein
VVLSVLCGRRFRQPSLWLKLNFEEFKGRGQLLLNDRGARTFAAWWVDFTADYNASRLNLPLHPDLSHLSE